MKTIEDFSDEQIRSASKCMNYLDILPIMLDMLNAMCDYIAKNEEIDQYYRNNFYAMEVSMRFYLNLVLSVIEAKE